MKVKFKIFILDQLHIIIQWILLLSVPHLQRWLVNKKLIKNQRKNLMKTRTDLQMKNWKMNLKKKRIEERRKTIKKNEARARAAADALPSCYRVLIRRRSGSEADWLWSMANGVGFRVLVRRRRKRNRRRWRIAGVAAAEFGRATTPKCLIHKMASITTVYLIDRAEFRVFTGFLPRFY